MPTRPTLVRLSLKRLVATLAMVALPFSAFAQETKTYYVHVKTGTAKNAGTDGKVMVTLIGMGADTEPTRLDTRDYGDFEANDGHWYKVHTEKQLGRIKAVKLSLEGNDGWQVAYVYVVGETLEQRNVKWPQSDAYYDGKKAIRGDFYRFIFENKWLDGDNPNVKKSRIVTRADYEDTMAMNVLEPAEGSWIIACSNTQTCGTEVSSSVSMGQSKDTSKTAEAGMSIGLSIKGGYEFPGGPSSEIEASTEVTASVSKATSQRSSSKGTTRSTCSTVNEFKTKQTAIYQWQVSANLGFGQVNVTTCQLACVQNEDERKFMLQTQPPSFDKRISCSR